MDKCPEKECRFPPSKECKTATDWVYNYMCNDEDYFLDANCDEEFLRLKCVNKQGDETNNFRYYDPDIKIQARKEAGRKNKEEFDELLIGKLKPKKYKRKRIYKKKKSKRKRKKSTKRKKKQTKRKKR